MSNCNCRLYQGLFAILIFFSLQACAQIGHQDGHYGNAPRLTFNELVYDFGIAGPEEKITHTFEFKNTGSSTLEIYRYETSCGCLASIVSKKIIPPGDTGKIKVTFKTRRFIGKQEKAVEIYSNDPERPKLRLVVRGVIKKDVAVVPSGGNFGKVDKGQAVTKRISLLELSNNKLVIRKIDYNHAMFSIRTARFRRENSRGIDVEITLKPEVPPGQVNEVITVNTNLKKRPRIDIPVWAHVVGDILVSPDMLAMGRVKKGETAPQKIRIFSKNSEFKIRKIKCNLPFITFDIHTVNKHKDYEIRLNLSRLSPAGSFSGMIDIFTDRPDQEHIQVPVYGILRK